MSSLTSSPVAQNQDKPPMSRSPEVVGSSKQPISCVRAGLSLMNAMRFTSHGRVFGRLSLDPGVCAWQG
jgi:hypothetical protein